MELGCSEGNTQTFIPSLASLICSALVLVPEHTLSGDRPLELQLELQQTLFQTTHHPGQSHFGMMS